MAVEIENNNEQTSQTNQTPESTQQNIPRRRIKKASKRRGNDVKHVSRKLIMAWKLASEHPNITWKEVAPIIDSVEYISSHWKSDERLKDIEPVAIEIVQQVNKIHVELNLRVFGMNRLRIITEEFLNLLKKERDEFVEKSKEKKEKESEGVTNQEQSSEIENSMNESSTEKNENTKKTESKPLRSKEDLIDRLILSLTQLYDLLNEPSDSVPSSGPNSPKATYITPQQKHKSKKRNLFSGFFSSDRKQASSSSNTASSSINSPELSTSSIPSSLEVYKNNIVSEWQEYTRKYVEPNYLFKVCKCYLAANPTAIPEKASLIGQNWICVANEISVSLWNILKKREDDLASSLIFLTLYKHGSNEIIERAINTIGSQLPHYLYVRLEYALKIKEFEQFTKEEQQMLDSNYIPEELQQQIPASPISPSVKSLHKKSNPDFSAKRSISLSKKDKKKHMSLSTKSDGSDEPLSFADMLAM
ncbi:hypothetical protein BCR36DRAFT_579719 [Piromyces finnis]|uniref:Uncharacterized protein n=1 Tax=Piromyces finnis TaxID=1754191 RepID=A0A1Y1VLB7_9FUNG|nr:hypothetical protein BCR36DRAFT_579719 [Piromyces finnis]|eukprot:ORX59083.1 hypothetical protein BCR36DRAFT_579719 [Piromyces finnis]